MAKQFKKAPNRVQKVVKKVVVATHKVGAKTGDRPAIRMPKAEIVATIGRRKTATARVRLYLAPGDMYVNDIPAGVFFKSLMEPQVRLQEPFTLTDTVGRFAATIKVEGSGPNAQLEAARLGLARALIKVDEAYKPILRAAGFLTRDSRMKETRKPNTGGKARRTRQSPKR